MFIINPYLRFALIAILLIGGIALSVVSGFWYGFPFWVAGLVLLIGYILLGTVGPAAKALQTQDFAKSEKLLGLTLSPKLMIKANRAYYYMLKGSIAMQQKNTDDAEVFLKMADELGVPTENEKAMIQIQLSNIAATRQKWKAADQYLRQAKQCKVTEPMIKDQISQLESAYKQRGQMKAATRMGRQGHQMMRQGKGKRRRPKMR